MPLSFVMLSPVETQVVQLLRDGRSNAEIAAFLRITDTALQRHFATITAKVDQKMPERSVVLAPALSVD
jgi:DNA-binding NarL/FixJ family response regulator